MIKDLRFKLWWILKSPWTKKYGIFNTLKRLYFAKVNLSNRAQAKLNILVCVKDRKEALEKVFIPSVTYLEKLYQTTLTIVCHETEKQAIEKITASLKNHIELNIIAVSLTFSRANYLNVGLRELENKWVFITDVDVALPARLHYFYNKNVNAEKGWFPICDLQNKNGEVDNKYPEAAGLVGYYHQKNLLLNKERKEWGNEDWEFLYTLFENGIYPERSQNDGFIHHYHNPVYKENYKKSW